MILIVFGLFSLPAAPPALAKGEARTKQLTSTQVREVLTSYLAVRGKVEEITGAAFYVDGGLGTTPVEGFAGNDGMSKPRPLDDRSLFQIGSNTKHFTAALMLMLEARGLLDIRQNVGDFLPQYPAWRHVSLRSLLNMTSKLPNYTETVPIGTTIAADTHHQFTNSELLQAVYPGTDLPKPAAFFYSNTNSILAALVIEKVTRLSFKEALNNYIIKPFGLKDTYYADGAYSDEILRRLPNGIYANHACLDYQPKPCHRSTLAPLIGHSMRTQNMSWAAAAGGIVASPVDLAKWVRALFALRVFPEKQLIEMTQMVSNRTGEPIADVSAADPRGFALDLGRIYDKSMGGTFWFYQGDTLGFRTIFAYWPQYDLLMTGGTNSQPPSGEDRFGPMVFSAMFRLAVPNADVK